MKEIVWNLNDIYATEEDFQKDWKLVEADIEKLKAFEGKLNTERAILEYLTIRNDAEERLEKLYKIRKLKKDENVLDEKANKRLNEVESLCQKSDEVQTFFEPELLENSQEFLQNIFINEPELETYRLELEQIIKCKSHILSKDAEDTIIAFSRVFESLTSIYNTLTDGDLVFKDVYDSNGIKHQVSESELVKLFSSSDTVLRRETFNSLYDEYEKHVHTISKIYLAEVQKCRIESELRKYTSFFEQTMEVTDSSVKVYDSLIKAVNDNLGINHRYYKLKKKLLGLEKMYVYDRFTPIIPKAAEYNYSYEESQSLVLEALAPLGEEYSALLKKAFESNWAHVYPRENKRTNNYNSPVYGVHPFVLLNFSGILDTVMDVAHEFGHALHTYYSHASQPYETCNYSLIVGEVVSITNEVLLSESLINKEKDLFQKINYLQSDIERFNSTVVRSTMFAEFEKWVHEETRKGTELTCEDLCNYYGGLVKKYFGEAVNDTDGIEYEWARIPHFFRFFYVYKYAIGEAAAISIVENILEKGESYSKKYIEMLKMGGSIKPLDQLKSIDVDLETDEPIKKAFMYYERKIDELERLINQI